MRKRWFGGECLTMKRRLKELGKQLKAGKVQVRIEFFEVKKKYRYTRLLRDKVKINQKNLFDKMNASGDKNPQTFWQSLNELRKDST